MWRSHLARTLYHHRNQPEAKFLQLATVGLDQRPHNRTVVFRGFLENGDHLQTPLHDCLKFVTDRRSQKPAQINANPWAEVSWYFTKTRSQFRILGKLQLIDHACPNQELQVARIETWQALSDPARVQFSWPTPREARVHFQKTEPPNAELPLDSFCLLLLEPIEVDRLELRGNPQNRWIYLRDDHGNWIEKEVNP
ncbi:MAG: Npun_F5749 family FMN-dependent PPOX-type flavoprotein [Pseudanabaena sp.]|jgi:pyridoxamine 5'-phosphate oxidase|uniref:Npun_F5749 family FMN-dependent PPOX-type flavoprotein n=1 Tax=Pseudanabaena mucicola TaxID=71190 RepID=UPI002576502C|nr:Npun_F5749 family FMN-dependent PPOX-type flavoprotein [Pseudanabaena mucicola]MCA6574592.1 pyridoxamine 5'-phosphate oxidase family protein [Pseudanabaena sp. M53BS1SP1A06MG]MCA6584467.1 pyridoxamine 5'-phosphate oxidase family protein [Pseudanabaena sp. M34BS1SP1A06MG]MCA6586264.1 pyridoxamine 5'-phosphate oxidase family protein [Pseudanabaena sp. M051S1SP1A06QC]MCA6588723.1 pyridoxamine 5'-phosphate oxidase family protein [Pseudanabaena sp. M109S1SP1A06QC]MCA6592295.1 pyridoxamine 5'-pho